MEGTKVVKVGGVDYTLQGVKPRLYYQMNDKFGMTGGKRDTAGYVDWLLRSCVVDPPEIKVKGLDYFDEKDDIDTPEQLVREIESFLRPGK